MLSLPGFSSARSLPSQDFLSAAKVLFGFSTDRFGDDPSGLLCYRYIIYYLN